MSALFLKTLNMSLTASWMILAVMIARWALTRAPRRIICLMWTFAAIRLILPFSLSSPLSLIPSRWSNTADIILSDESVISVEVPETDQTINPAAANTAEPVPTGNTEQPDRLPEPNPAAGINPWQIAFVIVPMVWTAGILIMILYAVINYLKLKKLVSASIRYKDNVMICDEVKSPFILGILKPYIYIPSGMNGQTLDHVMRHERVHLARRDYLWKPLGYIILVVHWFNPLCWAAYILFCRDVEAACDEAVIRDMDRESIADYMHNILDCSQPDKLNTSALAFCEGGTGRRIRDIARYKKPTRGVIAVTVIISLAMAACLMTDPIDENIVLREQAYKPFISELESPGVNDKDYLYCFRDTDNSAYRDGDGLLYSLKKGSGEWEILCKESNCLHASEDCPAYYSGRHKILSADLNGNIRVIEFAKAGHNIVIWDVDVRRQSKNAAASFDLDDLTDTRKDGSVRRSDYCEYQGNLYVTYPAADTDNEKNWLIRIDLQTMKMDNIICFQPSILPAEYSVVHRFEFVENNTVYMMLENAESGQMSLYGFDLEKMIFTDTQLKLDYRTSYCLAGHTAVCSLQQDGRYYLKKTDIFTGESEKLADLTGSVSMRGAAQYPGYIDMVINEPGSAFFCQLNPDTGEIAKYNEPGAKICKSYTYGYAAYIEFMKNGSYKLIITKTA